MLIFPLKAIAQAGSEDTREHLWQSFLTPPDSIRVGCYYYWVNEQVDPQSVVADLQWMKDNGITLAFLATDIRNRGAGDNPWEGQTFGKNKFQSRLWWKNLRTALKTAGKLGIEMGIFNCPGWSQSGGPWVKPDEAMRNWTPNGIEICKTKEGKDVVCSPCSPEAEGLEVDKLSKTHVRKHFEAFIGEILRRIPAKDRPTLTTVVIDSWERGKQNYTDSIFEKFRQRYGYELDYTNAAHQKDLDHLISDLVANEYVGGLTEKAHEYGLRTWCEPYAHSPFPANSITYGSAADEVGAEFWVGDRKFRKKEVDAAVGAARRSGKNRVWAESFTDGWPELAKDDWSFEKLKPIADRYFHAGINASILHVVISQPGDDRKPAVRPWFGTYFDRRSKNAADMKPLVNYLRRCNFMLQLGQPLDGANDQRIMSDGTIIRFTDDSQFQVSFPDGRQELWNPVQGTRENEQSAVKATKQHRELIKQHIYADYKQMYRQPSGIALKFPYITPGSKQYAAVLWDWDSWLSDVALRQTLTDVGTDADHAEALSYEQGCVLNYLAYTSPVDGYMPIVLDADSDPDKIRPADIHTTNMHKPCLAQHAAFLVQQTGGEVDWLSTGFPRLEAFMKNYHDYHRHAATGLYYWQDDLAIGVDNDPSTFFRPKGSSASIYLNCLMYKELRAMAFLADWLTLPDAQSKYTALADSLLKAVREYCWDEKDGMYYSVDLNLVPFTGEPQ